MRFHRSAPGQESDPLRSLLNDDFDPHWRNPDGLRPGEIGRLIGSARRTGAVVPALTSAALDGSAEEIRLERIERRRVAAALRSVAALPARIAPNRGEAAA